VEYAALEAGYGSPSRAHARATRAFGMTPGDYRRGGAGMELAYTIVDSPLGRLLVAATPKGVSAVYMADDDARLERELREEYPAARVRRDDGALAARVRPILAHLGGGRRGIDLPLDVEATAFQWRVWQELSRIPAGETRTYGEVARAIGRPTATRAVARACATNPVSIVVPCHRVVGADGRLTGYRWASTARGSCSRPSRARELSRRDTACPPPGGAGRHRRDQEADREDRDGADDVVPEERDRGEGGDEEDRGHPGEEPVEGAARGRPRREDGEAEDAEDRAVEVGPEQVHRLDGRPAELAGPQGDEDSKEAPEGGEGAGDEQVVRAVPSGRRKRFVEVHHRGRRE